MTKPLTLYRQAVLITEEYLGPAGERFLRRQITTHLEIEPEQLAPHHVPKLTDWLSIAFAMMTKNPKVLDSFAKDLKRLAAQKKSKEK